jgi:uncharacterized iron-regulated protein
LALAVPLSRFASQFGGGSAFFVRQQDTPMKTQHQAAVLLIGICLCAICALFPPRRLHGGDDPPHVRQSDVTHAFLFSDEFTIFRSGSPQEFASYQVELDAGSLLAELVLIASLTGIIILVPRLRI